MKSYRGNSLCYWKRRLWIRVPMECTLVILWKKQAFLTQISDTRLLPSCWIIIMQKWHTVGIKELCLFKPNSFHLSLSTVTCQGPHWISICSNPTISQIGRLSPRDIMWCAQEHAAYRGRVEIQTQAGLPTGVLRSPRHVPATPCTWCLPFPGPARWTWSIRNSPFLLLGFPFSSSSSTVGVCNGGGVISRSPPSLDFSEVSVYMCSIYKIHKDSWVI